MSATRTQRVAFWIAAAVVGAALALHAALWWRVGAVSWPVAANMGGLLVMTLTGALNVSRGPARTALTIVALALILPSAVLIWMG